jgi:hypothetical protein
MEKQVFLPIQKIKSKNQAIIILIFYLTAVLGLILSVFFFKNTLLMNLSISIILLIGFVSIFYKNYKKDGILIINELEIKINKIEKFSINEIKELKIIIGGYEGQFHTIRGFTKSGNSNCIEFKYQNKKYKFDFFLSYQKYLIFDTIIEKWKNEHPEIFKING